MSESAPSVACVALFGTRNDDNLARIYRLCAWFAVPRLAIVGSEARPRGNLFSARQRIELVRILDAEEFLCQEPERPIVVATVTGG